MLTDLVEPILTLLGIELIPALLLVLILVTIFKD